jgi:uncharacterized protein (TIGR03435 family)
MRIAVGLGVGLLVVGMIGSGAAWGQESNPTVPQIAFEVASVRACPRDHGYTSQGTFPANRVAYHNMPLQIAVAIAFNQNSRHISGPNWLSDACYDIDAKVEGDAQLSLEQMRPLLQSLLKDRFHLAAHNETRIQSGYALVVAKDGPKLIPSKDGGQPHVYTLPDGVDVRHGGVSSLASALSSPGAAGGPVIDKTGIQGDYDIKLHYAALNSQNSNLPDLFTAIQEQIGLKLVSQKVPVDFLVIDRIEKPSEN